MSGNKLKILPGPGELLVLHETAAVTDQVPELGQLQPPPEAPDDPGLPGQ